MDEKESNIVLIENLKQGFDEAVAEADWEEARAALSDLEEMKVDTYELRRQMNEGMAEEKELEDVRNEKWENHERDERGWSNYYFGTTN